MGLIVTAKKRNKMMMNASRLLPISYANSYLVGDLESSAEFNIPPFDRFFLAGDDASITPNVRRRRKPLAGWMPNLPGRRVRWIRAVGWDTPIDALFRSSS